ncbi:hypothetical protein C9994_11130 [Marivirga lumbricoides]|uniref:DUF2268 domain-containing protein n=1 Tax=Marivirga lumbricoides TaxID=1046115 RepID=A0A2T4DP31_9BACT|nr:hypothetical protein C9994_11130 [Marivirga lumbricoides]
MKEILLIFSLGFVLCSGSVYSQSGEDPYSDIITKVQKIEDSITVGKMTIHNAFKHQILAHQTDLFDTLRILNRVYRPNKQVFDECLSHIFGEENGKKFKPSGLYEWNKNLLPGNKELIEEKLSVLDSVDLNTLFTSHLKAIQKITEQEGEGKWIVYFGPNGFQIFGGCSNNSMILDMFGEQWNAESINKVFAHELEHLIFGPVLENDSNGETGLGITLDEGLAVYFTSIYLDQTEKEALYGDNTEILLAREREIFEKLEPYFFKTNEEGCPIFRHCGRNNECEPVVENLPEEIENELCYFLGYRIIEKYVEKNGENSWKDIYNIPLKDFYEKSGYKKYINSK